MTDLILPDRRLEAMEGYYRKRKPVGNVRIDVQNSFGKSYVGGIFPTKNIYSTTLNTPFRLETLKPSIEVMASNGAMFYDYRPEQYGFALANDYFSESNYFAIRCDPDAQILGLDRISSAYSIVILFSASAHSLRIILDTSVFASNLFCQFLINSETDSSATIRAINTGRWTAADDETFSVNLADGNLHLLAMTWDGVTGVRSVHLDNQVASRTGYTGTVTVGSNARILSGNNQNTYMMSIFDRALTNDEVVRLYNNPYQFLIPA